MGCENTREINQINKKETNLPSLTSNNPHSNNTSSQLSLNKPKNSVKRRKKNSIIENQTKNAKEEKENKEELKLNLNEKENKKKKKKRKYRNSVFNQQYNINNMNQNFDLKLKDKKKSTQLYFNNTLNDFKKLSINDNDNDNLNPQTNEMKSKKNNENDLKLRNEDNNNNILRLTLSSENESSIKQGLEENESKKVSKRKIYLPDLNSNNSINNHYSEDNNSQSNSSIKKRIRRSSVPYNELYIVHSNNNKNNKIIKLNNNNLNLNPVSRNSVSINIKQERKNKKDLTKNMEIPLISNLMKTIKHFHKLNKELFSDIENLIDDNAFIYKKVNFVIIKNYNFNKRSNENPIYKENIQFRILNKKIDNNWEDEPLKKFKEDLELLFKNEKYINFADLSFDKQLKEYEKIPFNYKIPLIKLFPSINKIEEIIFDFRIYSNVIVLFFFDDSEESLNTLRIISNFKFCNSSMFNFIPIYCSKINNNKEALDIFNQINKKFNFNLRNQELYFIINNKDKIIGKLFSCQINNKINPLIYILDKYLFIRSITNIENFNLGMIKNIKEKLDKAKYINQVNQLINIFEEQKEINDIFQSKLLFRKAELCHYDIYTGSLIKFKKFYEGLSGFIYGNQNMVNEIQKNIEINFLNMNQFPVDNFYKNNNESSHINEKELTLFIKNNTLNFSKIVGINFIDYNIISTNIIDFYSFYNSNFLDEKIENQKEEHLKLEFPIKILAFEKQIQSLLITTLNNILDYSSYDIDSMSCIPSLKQEFPSEYQLINPDKNFMKENISIINSNEFNFIIVFDYTENYLKKCEINSKINKLKYYLNYINVVIIFKGEIDEYKNMFEDLYIVTDNKIKNYILEKNDIFFPFFNQKSNEDNIFYLYLIDKIGNIIYIGNLTDLLLDKLLNINLINDDLDYDNLNDEMQNLQIKNYLRKNISLKEIEEIMEKFEICLENEIKQISNTLYYRPCIKFLYDKKYKTINGTKTIENIRIYIIIKERHKNIFTVKSQIKDLFKLLRKRFGALIIIIPLECEDIRTPINCKKCNVQLLNNVPYYYDQIDKNSYCENCEKNLSFINSNLIYIKSKNIDKEIISEFFNSNISINENLNKNLPEYCCICENQLEKIFYISLTQFNFKEGYNPICICQNCFDNLNNKDLNEFNRNNRMKEYCIHSDNLVLRKINSI